ncbi:hypothetical protein T265_06169 [Opisthorchis viverrini]|uniref:Uncharacterized protein n=1 Tax=Opisthorchis viverrini TaxID=6198 RepID=A0A074ZLC7_OPIVI|nr:hypothetical protein T265_06169 [Opisthorchis viverrini]KER26592.1 hypothetical protein T265_06169 [Opisthorchis viverrini]
MFTEEFDSAGGASIMQSLHEEENDATDVQSSNHGVEPVQRIERRMKSPAPLTRFRGHFILDKTRENDEGSYEESILEASIKCSEGDGHTNFRRNGTDKQQSRYRIRLEYQFDPQHDNFTEPEVSSVTLNSPSSTKRPSTVLQELKPVLRNLVSRLVESHQKCLQPSSVSQFKSRPKRMSKISRSKSLDIGRQLRRSAQAFSNLTAYQMQGLDRPHASVLDRACMANDKCLRPVTTDAIPSPVLDDAPHVVEQLSPGYFEVASIPSVDPLLYSAPITCRTLPPGHKTTPSPDYCHGDIPPLAVQNQLPWSRISTFVPEAAGSFSDRSERQLICVPEFTQKWSSWCLGNRATVGEYKLHELCTTGNLEYCLVQKLVCSQNEPDVITSLSATPVSVAESQRRISPGNLGVSVVKGVAKQFEFRHTAARDLVVNCFTPRPVAIATGRRILRNYTPQRYTGGRQKLRSRSLTSGPRRFSWTTISTNNPLRRCQRAESQRVSTTVGLPTTQCVLTTLNTVVMHKQDVRHMQSARANLCIAPATTANNGLDGVKTDILTRPTTPSKRAMVLTSKYMQNSKLPLNAISHLSMLRAVSLERSSIEFVQNDSFLTDSDTDSNGNSNCSHGRLISRRCEGCLTQSNELNTRRVVRDAGVWCRHLGRRRSVCYCNFNGSRVTELNNGVLIIAPTGRKRRRIRPCVHRNRGTRQCQWRMPNTPDTDQKLIYIELGPGQYTLHKCSCPVKEANWSTHSTNSGGCEGETSIPTVNNSAATNSITCDSHIVFDHADVCLAESEYPYESVGDKFQETPNVITVDLRALGHCLQQIKLIIIDIPTGHYSIQCWRCKGRGLLRQKTNFSSSLQTDRLKIKKKSFTSEKGHMTSAKACGIRKRKTDHTIKESDGFREETHSPELNEMSFRWDNVNGFRSSVPSSKHVQRQNAGQFIDSSDSTSSVELSNYFWTHGSGPQGVQPSIYTTEAFQYLYGFTQQLIFLIPDEEVCEVLCASILFNYEHIHGNHYAVSNRISYRPEVLSMPVEVWCSFLLSDRPLTDEIQQESHLVTLCGEEPYKYSTYLHTRQPVRQQLAQTSHPDLFGWVFSFPDIPPRSFSNEDTMYTKEDKVKQVYSFACLLASETLLLSCSSQKTEGIHRLTISSSKTKESEGFERQEVGTSTRPTTPSSETEVSSPTSVSSMGQWDFSPPRVSGAKQRCASSESLSKSHSITVIEPTMSSDQSADCSSDNFAHSPKLSVSNRWSIVNSSGMLSESEQADPDDESEESQIISNQIPDHGTVGASFSISDPECRVCDASEVEKLTSKSHDNSQQEPLESSECEVLVCFGSESDSPVCLPTRPQPRLRKTCISPFLFEEDAKPRGGGTKKHEDVRTRLQRKGRERQHWTGRLTQKHSPIKDLPFSRVEAWPITMLSPTSPTSHVVECSHYQELGVNNSNSINLEGKKSVFEGDSENSPHFPSGSDQLLNESRRLKGEKWWITENGGCDRARRNRYRTRSIVSAQFCHTLTGPKCTESSKLGGYTTNQVDLGDQRIDQSLTTPTSQKRAESAPDKLRSVNKTEHATNIDFKMCSPPAKSGDNVDGINDTTGDVEVTTCNLEPESDTDYISLTGSNVGDVEQSSVSVFLSCALSEVGPGDTEQREGEVQSIKLSCSSAQGLPTVPSKETSLPLPGVAESYANSSVVENGLLAVGNRIMCSDYDYLYIRWPPAKLCTTSVIDSVSWNTPVADRHLSFVIESVVTLHQTHTQAVGYSSSAVRSLLWIAPIHTVWLNLLNCPGTFYYLAETDFVPCSLSHLSVISLSELMNTRVCSPTGPSTIPVVEGFSSNLVKTHPQQRMPMCMISSWASFLSTDTIAETSWTRRNSIYSSTILKYRQSSDILHMPSISNQISSTRLGNNSWCMKKDQLQSKPREIAVSNGKITVRERRVEGGFSKFGFNYRPLLSSKKAKMKRRVVRRERQLQVTCRNRTLHPYAEPTRVSAPSFKSQSTSQYHCKHHASKKICNRDGGREVSIVAKQC